MMASEMPPCVYLDHHATTPIDPRVIDAMTDAMRRFVGNPNSVEHAAGRKAAAAIDAARADVAMLIGCDADQLRFTGSASDAIRKSLAIALSGAEGRRLRVAATAAEHPAMLAALDTLEADGRIEIVRLPVDRYGQLAIDAVRRVIAERVDLLCLMMANNEVGTVYPAEAVVDACFDTGVRTLIDATQAAGRLDLQPVAAKCDFLVLSGHKIYGPKGIGALFVAAPDAACDRIFDHAGTPDVAAIVGLGVAARLAAGLRVAEAMSTGRLRDRLQAGLLAELPFLVVNGDTASRLPYSLHISLPGIPNDAVLARVGHRLALSTGAACASGAQQPSHVLSAMGLPQSLVDSALRLSVGRFTTVAEIDLAVDIIADAALAVRALGVESAAC